MKMIKPDIWLTTVIIITGADAFFIWYDFTRGRMIDFGFDCFCLGMMAMVIAFAVMDCLDFRGRAREAKWRLHRDKLQSRHQPGLDKE